MSELAKFGRRIVDGSGIDGSLVLQIADSQELETWEKRFLFKAIASWGGKYNRIEALEQLANVALKADVDFYRPFLAHSDDTIQLTALQCIALIGGTKATPLIKRFLTDENPYLRRDAFAHLYYLDPKQALSHIKERMESETNPIVRVGLLACLWEEGDEGAAHELRKLTNHPHIHVSEGAARALKHEFI